MQNSVFRVAARVMRNASLLILYKDVGQRDRALKLERLGLFQMDRVEADQGRKQWSKGVITGV